MPDTMVMPERKNYTFFISTEVIRKIGDRAKIESRSTNRMVEVALVDYLRRHSVALSEDFPAEDASD